MDKKVVRKKNNKNTPKKTQTKKVTKTPEDKKISLNKTTASSKVKKTPDKKIKTKSILDTTECRHCHKDFEKGLKICPSCRRSQRDQTGNIVITILSIILILSIIGNHFIAKYYEEPVNESDYKYSCKLISYEDLVRSPKDYKGTDIKVIGKVTKVDGSDSSTGNIMNITIDANLFSGDNEQIITFEYIDKKYEVGFIEGDIVTVYGNYKSINGNTPYIDAKYIVFGS